MQYTGSHSLNGRWLIWEILGSQNIKSLPLFCYRHSSWNRRILKFSINVWELYSSQQQHGVLSVYPFLFSKFFNFWIAFVYIRWSATVWLLNLLNICKLESHRFLNFDQVLASLGFARMTAKHLICRRHFF